MNWLIYKRKRFIIFKIGRNYFWKWHWDKFLKHWRYTHTQCIYYLCSCWKISDQNSIKKRIWAHSGPVCDDGEGMSVRSRGGGSHRIYSQKVDRDACCVLLAVAFLICPVPCGMTLSIVRMGLPVSVNLMFKLLHRRNKRDLSPR